MIDYHEGKFLVRMVQGSAIVILVGTGLKLAFGIAQGQFWQQLEAAFIRLLEMAR